MPQETARRNAGQWRKPAPVINIALRRPSFADELTQFHAKKCTYATRFCILIGAFSAIA
ncbi:hypothetical protein [Polymorphobacter fuscus]|uniref:hypothetical protein n=1 Tax=Sandarakinorhabdus fusca TaxID=1439888 RepID=UPI0012955F45|nr:hypothetical protein [Polymorphobacter fuscus]NJC07916.1 hypothetical protein [Polymorphobacter fuscus]